jgi:hypothetical protein
VQPAGDRQVALSKFINSLFEMRVFWAYDAHLRKIIGVTAGFVVRLCVALFSFRQKTVKKVSAISPA